MAKQLNVNLAFTADTTQAKQQLQQLQQTLNGLAAGQGIQTSLSGMTQSIQQGIAAAAELKVKLQEATNVNTGKLDLGRFNQSLKQSGMTLQKYASQLSALGPQGAQAFTQLATSISNAEMPMVRVGARLAALGTTIKNTAKWQISSMALHGLISGVSSAFNYAKDLNESLNNIRIVTGQNVDQMKQFAAEANKAAQALSTTTTAYTNASLIYYQQGLSDKAVKERTDTTIKLANVTRESAETVSEWMTAIWNNFDDGSKKLEYYADVVTALGAATASSSDEIAQGLEKFAAIADTVGLSYEYATAALATVTAQTRQSADVVGTAFKTLFARIEGLQLGETQEDGTTLNKYSEALLKVGVNIKDVSGDLKSMDQILNEIGTRWGQLGKDQQVALAQAVGGIRQYNQMIALMDNWDYFQENLIIAQGSEGTLQDQADIYAESWEGASNRVQSAAEALYGALINDEFFIELTNGFADFLKLIDKVLDAMGGLPGLLSLISAGMLHFMGPQIVAGIQNLVLNLQSLTKAGREQQASLKSQAWSVAEKLNVNDGTAAGAVRADTLQREARFQQDLLAKTSILSEEELKIFQTRMDGLRVMESALEKQAEQLDILRKQNEEQREFIQLTSQGSGKATNMALTTLDRDATALARIDTGLSDFNNNKIRTASQHRNILTGSAMSLIGVNSSQHLGFDSMQEILQGNATLEDKGITAASMQVSPGLEGEEKTRAQAQAFEELNQRIAETSKTYQSFNDISAKSVKGMDKYKKKISETLNANKNMVNSKVNAHIKEGADVTGKSTAELGKYVNAKKQAIVAEKEHASAGKNVRKTAEEINKDLNNSKPLTNWTTALVGAMQGVSSLAMGLSSLSAIWNTFSNAMAKGKLEFSDVASILMSLGMAIPMLISGFTALAGALGFTAVESLISTTLMVQNTAATEKNRKAFLANILTKQFGATVEQAQAIATAFLSKKKEEQTIATLVEIAAENGLTISKGAATVATWLLAAANWGLLASMPPVLAIILLLVAALAGLALIVGGVVALFKAWKNSTPEEQLKKAKENAKALGEELQRVNEQATKLKETLESYDNAVNKLKECTRGTAEWEAALVDVNNQVLELMHQYPELATMVNEAGESAITRNAGTGALEIADWAQESLLNMQNDRVIIAQNAKIAADQAVRQADINLQKKEIAAEVSPEYSAQRWSTYGAQTAIGTGIAIAREIQEEQNQKIIQNNLEGLLGKTKDEIVIALSNLGVTGANLDEIADKIVANGDELASALAENTLAIETEYRSMATNIIMANDNYNKILQGENNTNLQSALVNASAKQLQRFTENAKGNYDKNDITDNRLLFWTKASAQGKDMVERYAELMGYQDLDIKNFLGESVKVKVTEDDKFVEKEWSYATIQAALAAEDAAKALDTYSNTLVNSFRDLANNAGEAGAALLAFSGDNINAMTLEQAQALGSKSGDNWILDTAKVDAALAQAGYATAEQREQYATEIAGYESYADFINQLSDAYFKYDEVLAETIRLEQEQAEINSKFESVTEELETTTGALENYTEALMDNNSALADNKKLAADIAISNAKFAKGMVALKDAFNDNYDVLAEWNEASLDTWEAVDALQSALKDMLGVDVSANFIGAHLEEIEKVINGDEEVAKETLDKLSEDAALDYVNNLSGVADETKNELSNYLTQLQDVAESSGLQIGMSLDGQDEMIQSLNELLAEGKISAEQLQSAFNAIGFNPDITYQNIETKTTTTSKVTKTGPGGQPLGTEDWITTTTGSTVVPQINGKNATVTAVEAGNSTYSDEAFSVSTSGSGTGFTMMGNASSRLGALTNDFKADKKDREINSLDEELDRYHEIKEEIEDINRELDALAEAKDRAFGSDKLALMDKELSKTEDLIAAQKQYLNEIQSNLSLDKSALSKYGASFDADGSITNYDELFKVNYAALEYAKNNYNDKQFEEQKELFEQFKEEISQYEDTLKLWKDEQQNLVDLNNQLIDQSLEKIEYTVEYKIELNEDSLKFIEHQLSKIEDDAFAAAEAIGLLGQQTTILFEKNKVYQQGISDILGASFSPEQVQALLSGDTSVLGDQQLTDQQISDLREYVDGLYEMNDALRETRTQMYEKLGEAFDAWNEKLDAGAAKIEHYGSVLENYKNIIDTVGKDALGISDEVMEQLNEAQVNNSVNALKSAKAIRDANKETIDNLHAQYEAMDKDSEGAKLLEEQIKAAEETLLESEENFMSSWNDALSAAADAFKSSVEMIAESFGEAVSGIYDSLDAMSEAFERQKEMNERYLQDYKKAYEINKLNRDITNSIDTTDNLKVQQQLRDLMSEINAYQAEGKQMSQYDLEYMQKKYDLLVAEAAFREAQNAKNQVRLQRDSEGNWGYVYTANEADSAKAEQSYEDKIYAMEDFMYNTEVELTEFYINRLSEYQSQVIELAELYGEDSEVFQEKLQLLQQQLFEDTGYSLDQLELFATRAGEINEVFGTRMVATYKNSILGQMYKNYADWSDVMSKVNEQVNLSIQAVMTKHTEFQGRVETVMEAAGTSADTFAGKVSTMAKTTNKKSDDAATDVEDMAGRMVTAFGDQNSGLIGTINTWETEYGNMVDEIAGVNGFNETLITSIGKVLAKYEELKEAKRLAEEDPSPEGQTNEGKGVTATVAGGGAKNIVAQGSSRDTTPTNFDQIYQTKILQNGKKYHLLGGDKDSAHWVEDKDVQSVLNEAGDTIGYQQTGGKSYMQLDPGKDTFEQNGQTYYAKNGLYYTGEALTSGRNNSAFALNISGAGIKPEAKAVYLGSNQYTAQIVDGQVIRWLDKKGKTVNDADIIAKLNTAPLDYLNNKIQGRESLDYYSFKHVQALYDKYNEETGLFEGQNKKWWENLHKDTIKGATVQSLAAENTDLDYRFIDWWAQIGDDGKQDWIQINAIERLDTGGYTGDWGDSSGRLAMLHRKEIILNASDTENFLQAIHIVRSISDKIEALAAFTAQGLGSLSVNAPAGMGDTLEQNVTIHAEFPNATNHSEIEQAFDNLINRASQYVNRK